MKILDRLPKPLRSASLRLGDKVVTVHRNQILGWVSVRLAGTLEPEGNTLRFPALLDTGNSFGFSLQDRRLSEWAGIDPGLHGVLGDIEINQHIVKCFEATVWMYPNIPGAAGGGCRQTASSIEDGQRDRSLLAGRCRAWPAIAADWSSRFARQRPRLLARS